MPIPSTTPGDLHHMMTGLRRILVTALLAVLVGLGAVLALLAGRRPRPRRDSVESLVPVAAPAPELPIATGRSGPRSGAVALLLLATLLVALLAGVAGVIHESRDAPFGPGSGVDGGDRAPVAALSRPDAGPVPTPNAPEPDARPAHGAARPGPSGPGDGPRFDVVRVEPSGDAVVAGRAAPNASVDVLVDGKPVARARADAAGHFTVTPPQLPTGSSEIALRATDARGEAQRSSARVAVVVAPSRDAKPLVAVTAPDRPTVVLSQPDGPAASRADPAAGPVRQALGGDPAAPHDARPPGQDGLDRRAAPHGPEAGGRATAGSQAGTTGPGRPEPGRAEPGKPADPPKPVGTSDPAGGPVAAATAPPKVVSIDAQADGRLFVTAQAAPGASVRLYLNDTLIAPATVGRDGSVTFTVGGGVRPGAYRVRLDRVDPATGQVRDRAEVPFSAPAPGRDGGVEYAAAPAGPGDGPDGADLSARREAGGDRGRHAPTGGPSDPPLASNTGSLAATAPPGTGAATAQVYVPRIETARIVRGDSLWRISRRTYGEGERYTLIYDANQDQIRDPDLIYPGQVFVLPIQDAPGTGANGRRD